MTVANCANWHIHFANGKTYRRSSWVFQLFTFMITYNLNFYFYLIAQKMFQLIAYKVLAL